MFSRETWAAVPFHFWSGVFFIFGCIVGSLLNVCIYRLPRGESIVFPGSHCPHCNYAIPWYHNIPLLTWLCLRGKCGNCGEPIAIRYLIVEFITGVAFLVCWLAFGHTSALLVLSYALLISGFIIATAIDFEHYIIPDEITLGGILAGFICSAVEPALHGVTERAPALRESFLGIAVGAGLIYGFLRLAKFAFGRRKYVLEPNTKIVFTEASLQLPDEEIPYEDIFYRKTDTIKLTAKTVELSDRCYAKVPIRLRPDSLQIGEDSFNPEDVPRMEIVTDELVVPREAMGPGDVKFMAAIGAFLGWKAVIFSLTLSSFLGTFGGIAQILVRMVRKESWSSRIPYGPYIAMAATVWIFAGEQIVSWWFSVVNRPLN